MKSTKTKSIGVLLLTLVFFCSSVSVCYAQSAGKTSCPKTVKAGQYFSYSLLCPDEYPAYDKEYTNASGPRVFECMQCEKWFYLDELIEGKESINGVHVLICPDCDEKYAQIGTRLPDGREVKNMYGGGGLGYGEAGQSWGCTSKITTNYQKSIPLTYNTYNDYEYIQIKKPGTYYLTAAYGVYEECNMTTQTLDTNTRQIVDTGKVQYKKVRCVQYTHNTITVLGKVKFNANKGKVKGATKWIKQKSKVGALPKATKKGYKFLGWYTKKKGGKRITKNTKVTFTSSTKIFYAHWKKK